MPRTKVALVLSGGTSLGSYIAGALDELMIAFGASDDYEIDIIAGASAGATTAAVIAHGLLYREGKTALHQVWVDDVDIVDLLAPDAPRDEPLTVLSARPLLEIIREQLAWDPAQGAGKRAGFCADTLTLALTLANTTALPYVSPVEQPTPNGPEKFVQFRHTEQETFELDLGLLPTDTARWQRIAEVARASAAIPFVFPLVRLARRADDPKQYIDPPEFSGELSFWYYDGGTYNNLPLDLAWYYVGAAAEDPDRLLENRRILVIKPYRSEVGTVSPPAEPPNLLEQAIGLLGAHRTESSAIEFEQGIERPSRLLRPPAELSSAQPPSASPTPDDAIAARALPGVPRPPVAVLENFALVLPRAGDSDLRGGYLGGLAAFLDRKFREYDFRRGAADAQRVARELLGIKHYDAQRPPGFYEPDADPTLRFDIRDYESLGRIPSFRDRRRSVRAVFEEALDRRIDALIRRWDAPGPDFALDPLLAGVLKRLVRERLPAAWNGTQTM